MDGNTQRARLLVLLVVALFAACGGDEHGRGAARSRDIEATPDDQHPAAVSPATAASPSHDLDDFSAAVDRTVSLPRMSFNLRVISTMPENASALSSLRTGSFDDDTLSGVGTRSFETDDPVVSEAFGTADFEFRVVDRTLWFLNALGEPPEWAGFDLVELARAAGGDPLASVDADSYLELVRSAIVDVVHVHRDASGASVWKMRARADDLLHLVAAAGPASRLMDAGAAESGLTADVDVHEDTYGRVSRVTVSMDRWWQHAVERAIDGAEAEQLRMYVTFELEPFDEPLHVQPPCEEPSTEVSDDLGLDALVCPA